MLLFTARIVFNLDCVQVEEIVERHESLNNPTVAGWRPEEFDGMPVERFFRSLLVTSRFASPTNKTLAIARLNTWWWITVVGDDGNMRGKPRMIRHTWPDRSQADWLLDCSQSASGKMELRLRRPERVPVVRHGGRREIFQPGPQKENCGI